MSANSSQCSKRKLDKAVEDEAPPSVKKCFSNLTNLSTILTRPEKMIGNDGSKDIKSGIVPQEMACTQLGEVTSNITKNSQEEVWFNKMRKIKNVLEHKFKDVSERLQLQSTPPCIYEGNLKNCQQLHSTMVEPIFASNESQYLAKNIIAEDRIIQFIQYVRNNMCAQKEFPGVEVMKCILEMILVSLEITLNFHHLCLFNIIFILENSIRQIRKPLYSN